MSNQYASSYSKQEFWKKVKTVPSRTSCEVLRTALTLYFILIVEDIPIWAKTIVIRALGCFICPIDVIPDAIPIAVYSDDQIIMTAALKQVLMFQSDHVNQKVQILIILLLPSKSDKFLPAYTAHAFYDPQQHVLFAMVINSPVFIHQDRK